MILAGLEDAIIDRLAARSGTGVGKLGYALTVASYAGEFDSEDDLAEAQIKFPCALVLLKEIGRGTPTGDGQKVPLTYTIFVAAQNRRGERSRRHGGAAGEIGTYQIAWDIRQLLKGQELGFADDLAHGLLPGPISSIFNGRLGTKAVSVYACSFATVWHEDLTPMTDDIIGEFLELDAAWDIPPHGNVTTPLPAAVADARDIVKPREA
ncbi:MAG: DUF1834 family protein [Magnetospirillum sp.]|nr:MAG: DUF1834 family protein [Magnetospirillum sp.]